MNFLAHAFLSGDNPEMLVGNFMGDFVKGKQFENYPDAISKGILLHREIDYYTDNHPIVEQSKIKLRPNFGHYAPVVVDIFYDHLLINNWHLYSQVDVQQFISNVYHIVDRHFEILPERLRIIFPNIKNNNWLYHYGYFEGVKRSLTGMSRRSRFQPELQRAVMELETYYQEFTNEFNEFFPDVIAFVKSYLESNN